MKLKIYRKYDDSLLNSEKGHLISFANLASLEAIIKNNSKYEEIYFFCDGWSMALLVSALEAQKIVRTSFDYTSIADNVFSHAEKNSSGVYLVGGELAQINKFKEKLKTRYEKLVLVGSSDGYFRERSRQLVINEIVKINPSIVLVSMGMGLQEDFLIELRRAGFLNTAFTCGGFFRQESASKGDYYPKIINQLNLRALYRMLKEPHTVKRYIILYPRNLIKAILLYARGRLTIDVE